MRVSLKNNVMKNKNTFLNYLIINTLSVKHALLLLFLIYYFFFRNP